MSERLPRVTGKQRLTALGMFGFEGVRTRGSHHFLRHQDGRTTIVPVHAKETVGPGLLGKILRDCKVTAEHVQEAL